MAAKIYDAEMQYLTIAYAKDVGLDHLNRVVRFDHKALTRQDAGLEPLLVYSVVAPAFKFYLRKLVDPRKPISITEFLIFAWSGKFELGAPLSLEVKKDLLKADSGYCDWLKGEGVQVLEASSIKSIAAFERSSLDVWFAAHWAQAFDRDYDKPVYLNDANVGLPSYDRFSIEVGSGRYSMEDWHFGAWDARDKRFIDKDPIADDWDVGYIVEKVRVTPNRELALSADDIPAHHVEGLKQFVAMWPGGKRAFFKGLKAKAKDFDFWVEGIADISIEDFAEIRARAAIEYRDDIDAWALSGNYLLEARTRTQAIEVYELLSHGGNVSISFEIVGPDWELASHRCLYFCTYYGRSHIILFERGKPVEATLSEKYLFCFSGAGCAPKDDWETIKAFIELRDEFPDPAMVGRAFYLRHRKWLDSVCLLGIRRDFNMSDMPIK